ncbi:MAG TPA: hypothetical protein VHW23_34085 [Kofleriaceae bacterium]|nr:hypothetical protein [Kofleriaceae bacterium]
MRWLLVFLTIAGCARAGKENSIIGGLNDAGVRGDGSIVLEPDAPLIDAPPQQVTLTQTTSGELALGASFDCHDKPTGFSRSNSYYRVFTLSDYGVATTLHVIQVDFGVDTATAGTGGMQPATIHIGTYGGTPGGPTLDLTQVRPITSADVQIPDDSTRMTVPIAADVAPGASLIVELALPDGLTDKNQFLIGVNAKGERRPGYTLSIECDGAAASPQTMQAVAASINQGETDIVLSVTGMTDTPN